MSGSYLLCTKDNEYEITLEEYTRNYQTFFYQTAEILFFTTLTAHMKRLN